MKLENWDFKWQIVDSSIALMPLEYDWVNIFRKKTNSIINHLALLDQETFPEVLMDVMDLGGVPVLALANGNSYDNYEIVKNCSESRVYFKGKNKVFESIETVRNKVNSSCLYGFPSIVILPNNNNDLQKISYNEILINSLNNINIKMSSRNKYSGWQGIKEFYHYVRENKPKHYISIIKQLHRIKICRYDCLKEYLYILKQALHSKHLEVLNKLAYKIITQWNRFIKALTSNSEKVQIIIEELITYEKEFINYAKGNLA